MYRSRASPLTAAAHAPDGLVAAKNLMDVDEVGAAFDFFDGDMMQLTGQVRARHAPPPVAGSGFRGCGGGWFRQRTPRAHSELRHAGHAAHAARQVRAPLCA